MTNKTDVGISVGISVGWADYYRPEADHQYIEIDNVKSGIYSIRFKINKSKLVHEERERDVIIQNWSRNI